MADGDTTRAQTLPPESAFVLQLQADAHVASDSIAGRVEHITSGRATRFASLGELLTFIAQTLEVPPGPSPPGAGK